MKVVVLLPHNVVKRPRSLKGLERLMAQGEFHVASVGRSDRATVEDLRRTWRKMKAK